MRVIGRHAAASCHHGQRCGDRAAAVADHPDALGAEVERQDPHGPSRPQSPVPAPPAPSSSARCAGGDGQRLVHPARILFSATAMSPLPPPPPLTARPFAQDIGRLASPPRARRRATRRRCRCARRAPRRGRSAGCARRRPGPIAGGQIVHPRRRGRRCHWRPVPALRPPRPGPGARGARPAAPCSPRACGAHRRRGWRRGDSRDAASASSCSSRWRSSTLAIPVTASIRRRLEPMEPSLTTLMVPMSPRARTCVPPHSSRLLRPASRTRTTSPYLSPKNATRPSPPPRPCVVS